MSIQLKVSNSLNSLADELCQQIWNENSVFRPVYIVTQTEGMNNWLKHRIAAKIGIAANIEFVKPNEIINRVFQFLGGTYRDSLSAHNLNWLLYSLLKSPDFVNEFPHIADYYKDEISETENDIKRMALAEKVADLFDQYQIYRTDMVKSWDENRAFYTDDWARSKERKYELNALQNAESWQKALWQKTQQLAGEHFPNKTEIGDFILKSAQDEEKMDWLTRKMPRVYFFGLSLITEYHLQIFEQLADRIELHFLVQNPAPLDYWFEERSEKVVAFLKQKNKMHFTEESAANPLLPAWGKIIRETFLMLFQNEQTLNSYTETELIEPPKDSLLHHIQHSIFNNQKDEIHFSNNLIEDGSIVMNSCYSPVREVEVLYNYLVHLVDQKKEDLSARDIVVMVTDIDLYASYIKAVFDNAPHRFRYTIADESYIETDSIANALVEILSLNEQQLTSEKVVSLLDYSVIRNRFGITDTEKIRNWVKAANIRFGMEGSREDDSDFVSWKYGLQRIMYGLCMSGGEEFGEGEQSFYPLDLIEGFDMMEAGRFVYFVENLIQSMENRRTKKNIAGWVEYLNRTLSRFIGEKEEVEDDDYQLIQRQLEQYNLVDELFDENIGYEVFIRSFLPMLSRAKKSSSFAGGGITFCSLIPMRSIPFKVVALLGMNLNDFPRKDRRVSFDLMELEKRKGDRNIRENDKHLFLETLLSAGDYLYISYTGQSVKDNAELPPSALVDELLDFISSKTDEPEAVRENFICKHPLHGFSRKYNSGNPKLYSYLLTDETSLPNLTSTQTEEKEIFDFGSVEISRFISFFRNPFKYFYNRVLGIYYEDDELSLPETEVFDLNHLEKWNLKNTLLNSTDIKTEDFKDKMIKTGVLPLKNMADVILEEATEDIEVVKEMYHDLVQGFEPENQMIEIELENSVLSGNIQGIYNNQLLRYSISGNEKKYRQSAYLEYLILAASGSKTGLKFISKINEKADDGKIISQEDALNRLNDLLKIFKEGHRRIVAFHPDFRKDKPLTEKSDFDKRMNELFNNEYSFGSDAYLVKEYENGYFSAENIFEEYAFCAKLLDEDVEAFFW